MAFSAVKWAGAVYLVYLGAQMLRQGAPEIQTVARQVARADHWVIYRQGLLTNLLNPKVAIFFLALCALDGV